MRCVALQSSRKEWVCPRVSSYVLSTLGIDLCIIPDFDIQTSFQTISVVCRQISVLFWRSVVDNIFRLRTSYGLVVETKIPERSWCPPKSSGRNSFAAAIKTYGPNQDISKIQFCSLDVSASRLLSRLARCSSNASSCRHTLRTWLFLSSVCAS